MFQNFVMRVWFENLQAVGSKSTELSIMHTQVERIFNFNNFLLCVEYMLSIEEKQWLRTGMVMET